MTAALRRRPVLKSIVMCVLIAGTLDIADALLFYGYRGTPPKILLQVIAAGLLGRSALKMGLFVVTSLSWQDLRVHPMISGMVYGLIVYAVMNYLVLPHTYAIVSHKFNLIVFVNAVAALVFCIGLPIAGVNRWILGRR
jgi:Na+/proline symporter